MAFFSLSAMYISSAKYAAITQWAATTAKAVGDIVRPLTAPTNENEYAFMAVVAGNTGSTEPTWSTTTVNRGQSYTDSGVTWIECTGQPAVNGDLTNTPNWTAVKGQSLDRGFIIKDNAGTHLFMVTSNGGTAGSGSEPSWNTAALGNTTTDSGITWTYIKAGAFANWACPHAKVKNCTQHSNSSAVNQYYVGNNHAVTYPTNTSIAWSAGAATLIRNVNGNQAGPIALYVVDEAGSVPPTTADLRTSGASETCAGSANFNISGLQNIRHMYGMTAVMTSTGGAFGINIGQNQPDTYYENCTFSMGTGVTGGASFNLNNNVAQGQIHMKGCTFKFNNASNFIDPRGKVTLEGCTFDVSVATPNDLFFPQGSTLESLTVVGSDLSSAAVNNIFRCGNQSFHADFVDCKLPSTFKFVNTSWQTALLNGSEGRVNYIRCDNGSPTYKMASFDANAFMVTVTTTYRDGGATDGTTPYAWQVKTSQQCIGFSQSFRVPPIATYFPHATGKSATIYGLMNSAAMPTNAEVYADVHYLGSGSSPIATIKSNRVSDFLTTTTPSNLTADTSDWDNGGTARQNSHAYALNDEIIVASNPGRVFFCTTAGTSAASEPGGYASAVDGGSVTDNGAVFRAGWRFKFSIALSSPDPALDGYVYTHIYVGKVSTTVYLDPDVSIA